MQTGESRTDSAKPKTNKEGKGKEGKQKTGQIIEGTTTVSDRKIDRETVVANVDKIIQELSTTSISRATGIMGINARYCETEEFHTFSYR